jgi:hypothetical protein
MQILLIVVVLFLLSGQLGGAPPAHAPPVGTYKGPPAPTPGDTILNVVGHATGVPLHELGAAASAAPTWVKVAEFPVAVTGWTYDAVRHPLDTAEKAWSSTTHAVEHPVDTVKSAYNTVKGWF